MKTAEQKARYAAYERAKRAAMSPEQKAALYRKRYAAITPAQKKRRAERDRVRYSRMTPEQRRYLYAVSPEERKRLTANSRKRKGLPAATRPEPPTCECCGGPPNGYGSLHLDHDHKTGKFRGWLCMDCNTSIGKLGDNVDGLCRAVEYLLRTHN